MSAISENMINNCYDAKDWIQRHKHQKNTDVVFQAVF